MSVRQDRRTTWISLLSVAVAGTIGIFSIFIEVVDVPQPVVLSVLVSLVSVLAFSTLAITRLYSVTTVSVNIALGGPPGVGKTVFVNSLCSALMEDGSRLLSFSPDAQTAQQVYRTVGILRHGEWPSHTSTDQIARYRGRIALRRQSVIRTLLNGRIEFRMEFGDSAGENWEALSDEAASKTPPRLIDSTFFRYIGDSDALLYFIDCETLLSSPETVHDQVDDLLSTLQLLRAIEGVRPGQPIVRPVGLVLSKADLLHREEFVALTTFFAAYREGDQERVRSLLVELPRTMIGSTFVDSLIGLERLFTVMTGQARYFDSFVISSKISVGDRESRPELLTIRERPHVARRDTRLEGVRPEPVERPAEWTFLRLWSTRRFRPTPLDD